MEDLKYLREAMDLISFMAGTEDSELDPQDVEILAQEIEATNSTGYDDYDDDHKVEQPADGINIMKLIETSIARYISNIKDANNGVNPHYLSNNVLNYGDRMNVYDKASAIIMSTFTKNKNDVEQQLDTEILKEYNKITMLIKNKAKMKKLMGTKNDPFLFEGIMVTYDLMTRLLLAYVPMKIQNGETLASILNKKSGTAFMKIFDVVKYINSIQSKLGTKIYYKPPLVSEITGKKIDTIKDTKFDFRRNDQDREDSGFRDYNREVIVTAGRESEEIDYFGTEGVLDSAKHYLWDVPKETVLRGTFGPKFSKEDLDFLNKGLPSIMRDYVRQVNKSPILKENNIKAELPDTMPIEVYKGWIHQGMANREMMIPIAKFTGISSFNLKFKTITAGGSWKMAIERFPGRWKKCMTTLKKLEDGSHLLLIESPGFRSKEVSVESFNFNPEMFYDSEDFINNYHLSCESIENLIEIRNNNSLLEYSKLIKGLAFTTSLFKPLTGYDVEELTKDIDKLLKDSSITVVNMITALIAKIDVKVITPINIEFKRYTSNEEGKSLLSEQFAPKEFDSSIQGRMYEASRPKVEDFEEF